MKAVPISLLSKDEKAKAVDTRTGRTQVKTSQAVLAHYDTDLYNLRAESSRHIEVIHT